MGITLQEVIDNELISMEVIEVLPETCECGAPIEFTESLRQIYCSNPRCTYKVAARLESMAKKMKVDGFGESTCVTLCKEFGMISPFQVFRLPDMIEQGYTSSVSAFQKKVSEICDPKNRKIELWKVVEYAGIPSIETIAYKIFGGYKNLTEAFDDIESGQVPFIANKLGLKNATTSVMAVNVYTTLMKYKSELLFGEKQFETYQPTGETLFIAITDSVNGFRNKSEFIQYINSRYGGKVNAMLMNSVTTKVEILVADGETNHGKFATAMRLNQKYLDKAIEAGKISPDQVGKFASPKDLHPIGEKILIGTSQSVIQRLDKVFGE